MRKKTTTINEQCRKALGITRDEYALCSYIQYRQADKRTAVKGNCADPKDEIADFIGVTRQGLYKMAKRLKIEGLIDIDSAGNYAVTGKFIDAENDAACKLSLHDDVNKVYTKQRKHVNKVYTHLYREKYKKDTSSLEADAALSITIHDPATPGATIHDEVPGHTPLKEKKEPQMQPGAGPGEWWINKAQAGADAVAYFKVNPQAINARRRGCDVEKEMERFLVDQEATNKNYSSVQEFRRHFLNWLEKRPDIKQAEPTTGATFTPSPYKRI